MATVPGAAAARVVRRDGVLVIERVPPKLERLCRYMARGPLCNERLSIDGDGLVVHELKRPRRKSSQAGRPP